MLTTDKDYTLRYMKAQPRYDAAVKAIYPDRVYVDPVHPQQAAIVELPFPVNFQCEQVFWQASRLSHRLPVYRPDKLEFFALFTAALKNGKPVLQVLFVGQEVFTVFQRWVYFVDKKGVNQLQRRYATDPTPRHAKGTYEAAVVNYEHGCVYADHQHLRKILSGLRF